MALDDPPNTYHNVNNMQAEMTAASTMFSLVLRYDMEFMTRFIVGNLLAIAPRENVDDEMRDRCSYKVSLVSRACLNNPQ